MDIIEIKNLFEKEFVPHRNKFVIYDLSLAEAENSQEQNIYKPGVYVFWHPTRGVIKVGRHLENSRMRAFEHLGDNTGGVMTALRDDEGTRLLLFNVKKSEDKHWVAALEIYFEEQLSPEIRSRRLG